MSDSHEILGQSAELQALLRSAQMIAATDVTLLIEGETGTGKELIAQHVHKMSPRNTEKFVVINCAALNNNLAESALFGHKKGSFTGATGDHCGYIEDANNGTLFLDEIGELSLSIQAKILRFIEYGECQRVGENNIHKYNVRIIAATNRDLQKQVEKSEFRKDLFYRLQIVPLKVPELKQRQGDIILLANYFIEKVAEQYQLAAPVLQRSAIDVLRTYSWPGNVRELRNFCERLVILLSGQKITDKNLPADFKQTKQSAFQLPSMGVKLDTLEADLMQQALIRSNGNKSKAARLLGLSRDAFLYRLKKYAL